MSKVPGFLMILAGVGAAAYVIPTMDTVNLRAEQQVSGIVGISAIGKSTTSEAATTELPPAPRTQPSNLSGSLSPPASAPMSAQLPVAVVQQAKPIIMATSESTPGPVRRDGVGVKGPDKSRHALTRDIQKELKRVGCYSGEVDGEWNTATQQSMKTFIDRVNATLPIDEPDHILKTLVQGHPGDACGKSCPAGQGLSTDGRCLPAAILAHSPKRIVQAPQRRVEPTLRPTGTTASIPVPSTPLAPSAETPRQKIVSSWESTVTLATPSAPLPGRMAIGAGPGLSATLPSIVTPRAPGSEAAKPPTPVAPRTMESAAKPVIVIKPRTGAASVSADIKPSATDFATREASIPAPIAQPPKIAAVTASEPPLDDMPLSRDVQQRRLAPPAYRPLPPPPRYVGVYSGPSRPVYTQRRSFGPEIFRRLEMNGR
jgi:hypothetical protein